MNKKRQLSVLAFARVNESDFDCALRVKEELDDLKSQLEDKRNNSFEAALRPAIEYLKGRHPHCSIIVTSLHAELLEGIEVINEQGIDHG